MMKRRGFTLIELMVALAVLLVLISMAFSSFSIASAISKFNQNRETVLEDMTTVLDQLTKELRQVTTVSGGSETNEGLRPNYGVTLPVAPTSADSSRGILPAGTWDCNTSVLTSSSPRPGALTADQSYVFNTTVGNLSPNGNGIVLEFFTIDTSATPTKHRIRYSLTAPANGVAQRFWADSRYEPCQVTYCNNTWNSMTGTWSAETPQPVTGQVITNFTVIRPLWSDKGKVIQIVLEAMVKNASGGGSTKITRIAQISVRQ